jgi:hypothetical protein
MLRPVSTSNASASSAPLPVHATAAADLSPDQAGATKIAAAESAGTQQAGAIHAERMLRYNSFEFVYRQDIGRIVLIGQSPETGERVIQVPSEQVLRAYERTARVERQLARIQTSRSSAQSSTPTPAPAPTSQPVPQLAKALVAAVSGANHGSGLFSLSA